MHIQIHARYRPDILTLLMRFFLIPVGVMCMCVFANTEHTTTSINIPVIKHTHAQTCRLSSIGSALSLVLLHTAAVLLEGFVVLFAVLGSRNRRERAWANSTTLANKYPKKKHRKHNSKQHRPKKTPRSPRSLDVPGSSAGETSVLHDLIAQLALVAVVYVLGVHLAHIRFGLRVGLGF
jgi:hypothetical protein